MSRYSIALAMMMVLPGPSALAESAASAGRVPMDAAGPVPVTDGDPAMMCVFQHRLSLYQSGTHGTGSWPDMPRLDICDIPIGPGRAWPRS